MVGSLSVSSRSLFTFLAAYLALAAAVPANPSPAYGGETSFEQTESDIEARYKQGTEGYEQAFDAFEKNAGLDQAFHYDLSALAGYLRTQMRSASSLGGRQLAAVYLPTLCGYEVALPQEDLLEVSRLVNPESSAWAKSPDSIGYLATLLPPSAARKFLNDLISRNPDRLIQAKALIDQVKLAARQREATAYQDGYRKLSSEYKDLKEVRFDIALLNPENKTAIGKKVASFSLPAVEGNAAFSSQALAGKYYLLDFWATWCGPCMGERAGLRRAYERFKDRNFTIVSISLDEKPEAVRHFLDTRWAMPWENLILPDGQKSQTAKDYDVDWIGLPHLLLVGPDGTILANRDQLGRESLQATLAEFLRP